MAVPTDPYDFTNGTIADGDQVDLRFKRLYDALNPTVDGLDATNFDLSAAQAFLQLVAPGTHKFGIGTSSGLWAGAFLDVDIAHGLGADPIAAAAFPKANGSVVFYGQAFKAFEVRPAGVVRFKFAADGGAALGGTMNFAWVAIT